MQYRKWMERELDCLSEDDLEQYGPNIPVQEDEEEITNLIPVRMKLMFALFQRTKVSMLQMEEECSDFYQRGLIPPDELRNKKEGLERRVTLLVNEFFHDVEDFLTESDVPFDSIGIRRGYMIVNIPFDFSSDECQWCDEAPLDDYHNMVLEDLHSRRN